MEHYFQDEFSEFCQCRPQNAIPQFEILSEFFIPRTQEGQAVLTVKPAAKYT